MSFRSGFIGLIGRPNAGKSTLLNALVQEKVAIMANKPQTTRNIIRGVRTDSDSQMVFVDTPGVHKPQHKLGEVMVSDALSTIKGVDIIYLIIDASVSFGRGDEYLLGFVKESKLPVFLILNKVDLLSKQQLIHLLQEWQERHTFKEIIPVSALKDNNIERLIKLTKTYLSDTIKYYPDDQISDYPEQFIIAEIIREKLIVVTEQEVPHSAAVIIENIRKKRDTLYINALVLIERDSQKGIVIGKNGERIKKVASQARAELEQRLGNKIFLEVFVRVEKDWRNRQNKLRQLGYIQIEEVL